MFRHRLKKLLNKENPIAKIGVKEFDSKPIEVTVVETGGDVEEVPDFFSMFGKKDLTESEDHDMMDDSVNIDMEALKLLMKKIKSER